MDATNWKIDIVMMMTIAGQKPEYDKKTKTEKKNTNKMKQINKTLSEWRKVKTNRKIRTRCTPSHRRKTYNETKQNKTNRISISLSIKTNIDNSCYMHADI